jgi:glycosyltransferase involved in cell wall biosynthesis
MPRGLTLLCAAKLHANQLERHLELFEYVDEVERVLVVRREPLPERLSKLENRTFEPGARLSEAFRLALRVKQLIADEGVDWVIGFNPVPWGSIAFGAAKVSRIPTCLSLIGMDYLQIQRPWGWPFLEAVRRADAITVTGNKMRQGLVARGVPEKNIHILPHSVDIERFSPRDSEKKYDVLSVGQLIERKRMDVLIDSAAELARQGLVLRVGILGRGPLEEALKARAERAGVAGHVEFLSYRDDVEAVLASARSFCLASEWEGVPFALMEAMAAGLVPVVTNVGTIEDWVTQGENGFIVPPGDVAALSSALRRLFSDGGAELHRLRTQLMNERERLGFERGAQVWRDILLR